MKHPTLPVRLGLLLVLFSLNGFAAVHTATLHLFDRHIRVEKGESRLLGQVIAEIQFSSVFDFDNPNGEWFYLEDGAADGVHVADFLLTDPTTPGFPGLLGQLASELPVDIDEDGDGIPDFHQVHQAMNVSHDVGYFEIGDPLDPDYLLDSGSVRIDWTRSAGAHRGTCVITLSGQDFITAPLAFTHAFEIAEYEGTYSYVPSVDIVLGDVQVTRIGSPDQWIRGSLALELWQGAHSADGADLQLSRLTNSLARAYILETGYVEYSPEFPVEYFGEFLWSDNDLASSEIFGYGTYFLGIDDANDHDLDGIPDLTDPPVAAAPPRLTVSRSGNGYAFEIEGELNRTFQLQRTPSLTGSIDWTEVGSITLTNSPQGVALTIPDAASAFWRLVEAP